MVLINSNRQKNKSEDDILFKIKNRLRKTYVQKSVIGYARTELDKTFRESLTEEEQLDFQVSFQNSKKYLQHKKIFPNGIIEKRTEEILLLPYIKVL